MKRRRTKEAQADADQSKSSRETSSPRPTNRYSPEEQDRLKVARETAQWIKTLPQQCCDGWLTVIGPAMVMVRDRIFEETGATSKRDQAYRDVVNEELKQYGLGEDVISRDTRSCLLNIMEHLPEVEAWLDTIPNADQLNDPKTIWKHFKRFQEFNLKYEVDPIDAEDDEAWFGDDEEPEEIDCDRCGKKTIRFVSRDEGRYCPECQELADHEPCNKCGFVYCECDEDDATELPPFPSEGEYRARVIKEIAKANKKTIAVGQRMDTGRKDNADNGHPRREITCDTDHEQPLPDEPEHVTRARASNWQLYEAQRLADEFALLQEGTEPQEITDQVITEVEKTINAWSELLAKLHERRPEHAPPTVPGDDEAPHISRKVYGEALKKHSNKMGKVTPGDVGLK